MIQFSVSQYDRYYSFDELNEFLENVFEIASGDNAINKNYSFDEVVEQLKEFNENAWKYEELQNE